ncbi:MAG: hypothetical protein U0Q16_25830 [Bryobacteraceae bacterium]
MKQVLQVLFFLELFGAVVAAAEAQTRPMSGILAVAGRSEPEYVVDGVPVSFARNAVTLHPHGALVRIETAAPLFPGTEVQAVRTIPREAFELASGPRFGGAGYRRCAALRMADPSVPLRFLDSAEPGDAFRMILEQQGAEVRSLRSHAPPASLALPCAGGVAVVRSTVEAPVGCAVLEEAIGWLNCSQAVLANGVEDRVLLTKLAAKEGPRFSVVLSALHPASYWIGTILPHARAVFVLFGESDAALGVDARQGMAVALDALRLIRSFQREGLAFLTFGPYGALVAGDGSIYQVRVRRADGAAHGSGAGQRFNASARMRRRVRRGRDWPSGLRCGGRRG